MKNRIVWLGLSQESSGSIALSFTESVVGVTEASLAQTSGLTGGLSRKKLKAGTLKC